MKAEIIAVGTELLLGGRHDTNGDWLAARLSGAGVEIGRRTVVPDDEREIAEVLKASRGRATLVIVTGGLGPTKDDVTREALARSLGRPLRIDPTIRDRILAAYLARGYPGEGPAERQARIPEGCDPVPNIVGSAPGLLHAGPPCWTAVLPGVPREMESMFETVMARLSGILPGRAVPHGRLLVGGLVESEVDERLRDLIGRSSLATVTILAGAGVVELLVVGTTEDPERAREAVSRLVGEARRRLGSAVVGEGEATLASVVGELLLKAGGMLAVAESCTGGLLGANLTEVPGASDWFAGGFIVYSDALKRDVLGVPQALLQRHGAVSGEVAAAMARGARQRTGASHALAITGVAGPSGGSESKPVGLVHVALVTPDGTLTNERVLGGGRHIVRTRAVAMALDLLRLHLLEEAS